jgi:hypothetical protein
MSAVVGVFLSLLSGIVGGALCGTAILVFGGLIGGSGILSCALLGKNQIGGNQRFQKSMRCLPAGILCQVRAGNAKPHGQALILCAQAFAIIANAKGHQKVRVLQEGAKAHAI